MGPGPIVLWLANPEQHHSKKRPASPPFGCCCCFQRCLPIFQQTEREYVGGLQVDEFSAACWYFAQELTDMAAVENKTAPVIGLVQSAWGGRYKIHHD